MILLIHLFTMFDTLVTYILQLRYKLVTLKNSTVDIENQEVPVWFRLSWGLSKTNPFKLRNGTEQMSCACTELPPSLFSWLSHFRSAMTLKSPLMPWIVSSSPAHAGLLSGLTREGLSAACRWHRVFRGHWTFSSHHNAGCPRISEVFLCMSPWVNIYF